jgi:hypothetical protein
MTHRIAVMAVVLASLLGSPTALGAEPDESIPTVGVGVGVSLGNAFSGGSPFTSPVAVYVPINISEHFRLEPSFGYWYVGKGTSTTILNGSASQGGYDVDVGLGAFYVFRPVHPFAVYLGGRLGLNFSGNSEQPLSGVITETSELDFYVSPTLGLEWSIVRAFSVGGEAQAAFRWYGDPTVSVGGASTSVSRSKFGTGFAAILFMRLYF